MIGYPKQLTGCRVLLSLLALLATTAWALESSSRLTSKARYSEDVSRTTRSSCSSGEVSGSSSTHHGSPNEREPRMGGIIVQARSRQTHSRVNSVGPNDQTQTQYPTSRPDPEQHQQKHKEAIMGENSNTCPICLEEMRNGAQVTKMELPVNAAHGDHENAVRGENRWKLSARIGQSSGQEGEADGLTELACNHVFHRDCIQQWFEVNPFQSCPTCRASQISVQMQDLIRTIALSQMQASLNNRPHQQDEEISPLIHVLDSCLQTCNNIIPYVCTSMLFLMLVRLILDY